jgi:hypothetical protein
VFRLLSLDACAYEVDPAGNLLPNELADSGPDKAENLAQILGFELTDTIDYRFALAIDVCPHGSVQFSVTLALEFCSPILGRWDSHGSANC